MIIIGTGPIQKALISPRPETTPSSLESFWIRFNHLYALRTDREVDNWGSGRSIRVLNADIVDTPTAADKIAVFFLALFYTLFSSLQPDSLKGLFEVHAGPVPNSYLGRIWEIEQKFKNHIFYFSEDDAKNIEEFISVLRKTSPENYSIISTALFQVSENLDRWIRSNNELIGKQDALLDSDPLVQIRAMIKIASKYLPKQ